MSAIFEDVLRALLVGTDVAGTRVFLMRAPQKPAGQQSTPYLVFEPVASAPRHTQIGPISMQDVDYQIDIFDPSQSRALGIADTLRRKLVGVRGVFAGVRIGGIFNHSHTVGFEPQPDLQHVIVTFTILFEFLPEFENFTHQPRQPIATQRRTTL